MAGQVRQTSIHCGNLILMPRIGSFLEFLPILDMFRQEYTPSTLPYHLIVPSLPGYTFSSGPPLDRTFTTTDIARVLDQLMKDLGFESGYVAQGGDIGSRIARGLAVDHESCKGKPFPFIVYCIIPDLTAVKLSISMCVLWVVPRESWMTIWMPLRGTESKEWKILE